MIITVTKLEHLSMHDWITLDKEWIERTNRLLRRSIKELDMTLAKQLRDTACQSESTRREWRFGCWQEQESRTAATTKWG